MYPGDPAGPRGTHFWAEPRVLVGGSIVRALVGVQRVPQTITSANIGLRTHDLDPFGKLADLGVLGWD